MLLASITQHAVIRVCAVKPGLVDLPIPFVREFGLVQLFLTYCYTHMLFFSLRFTFFWRNQWLTVSCYFINCVTWRWWLLFLLFVYTVCSIVWKVVSNAHHWISLFRNLITLVAKCCNIIYIYTSRNPFTNGLAFFEVIISYCEYLQPIHLKSNSNYGTRDVEGVCFNAYPLRMFQSLSCSGQESSCPG